MSYIYKYNGFIIPDKKTDISTMSKTSSSDLSHSYIILQNPMTRKYVKTETSVEEFAEFTDEEYSSFVKTCKELIDNFIENQSKK